MSDHNNNQDTPSAPDVRSVVQQVIEEFVKAEQSKAEPAYKAELVEERKRREALESRLNVLVEENEKAKAMAEEADKSSQIRSELQRLGVAKLDLAFRAVKDEIGRAEDGRLIARDGQEQQTFQDYLRKFVDENPELLPARIAGGTGAHSTSRSAAPSSPATVTLDHIKPGMNKEELDRVRREIARVASQALKGF
jgi:hypothetical protein